MTPEFGYEYHDFMSYLATKTYGNDRGLSCAFRQWKADSHCNLLHGYAIGVRIVFESFGLDSRNWVYDFGDTKWIKSMLDSTFDHKTIVSKDDPMLDEFLKLNELKIIDLVILDGVGCERFARHIFEMINPTVCTKSNYKVWIRSVEVFEHGSNSATFEA